MKTNNKRPYVGVNGAVEGVVIQSDNPLCYDESGEFPPYEGIDADSLDGHKAEDFVLDSELDSALVGKANTDHTHSISQVNDLQNQLNGKAASSHTHSQSDISGLSSALSGKANSSHTHPASQISAGTFAGNVVAKSGGAVGTKMVRNIYAGTSDIGVGASLATGDIYLVYE